MNALKVSLFSIVSMSLSGCAGVITAWKNDPLQVYAIKGPSVYTMTGDRRTAVFTQLVKDGPLRYCAESMPDAIAAMAASSNATLKASGLKGGAGGEAGFADATTISMLQTYQRTENSELTRQMGWNLCLAWSQGAITDAQYHTLLTELNTGVIDVIKTTASKPAAAPAAAKPAAAAAPATAAPPVAVKGKTTTTTTTTTSEPTS